jgi:hypothetical protein
VSPADTAGSGAGYHLGLYRLFGDGDGNGTVDLIDLSQFRDTYTRTSADPRYLAYFDFDQDGVVDSDDLSEFTARFNHSLF